MLFIVAILLIMTSSSSNNLATGSDLLTAAFLFPTHGEFQTAFIERIFTEAGCVDELIGPLETRGFI